MRQNECKSRASRFSSHHQTPVLQAAEHLQVADVDNLKKAKVSLKSVLQYLPIVAQHYRDRLPGDLEVGAQHQKLSAGMYKWEPGLELISVQGKYGPFRNKLLKAWLQHTTVASRRAIQHFSHPAIQPSHSKRAAGKALMSPLDRGRRMFPIVKAALEKMDYDTEGVWSDNCGRGVGRVLGWLPLMSRLSMIAHGRKPGKQLLHLGASSLEYHMLPAGEAAAHKKLALMAEAGDELRKSLAQLPDTAEKCVDSFKEFENVQASAFLEMYSRL